MESELSIQGSRGGSRDIFWKMVDGTSDEERLTSSDEAQFPGSVSPDGKILAIRSNNLTTGIDIWVLSLRGDRKPEIFLRTPFNEQEPMSSPDGRWLAYQSNESGREEIYVCPFPGVGGKWQVSTAGGTNPRWARSGRELFYRSGHKMMAVEAGAAGAAFSAGQPQVLFESDGLMENAYDVAVDGFEELKRKVSVR